TESQARFAATKLAVLTAVTGLPIATWESSQHKLWFWRSLRDIRGFPGTRVRGPGFGAAAGPGW
ncbi:MAG: hypothetical protein ACRDN0_39060, partial [Trebonia sp.]